MATTVLKSPPTFSAPSAYISGSPSFLKSRVTFASNRDRLLPVVRCRIHHQARRGVGLYPKKKLVSFAANGETAEAQTETREEDPVQGSDSEPDVEASTDGAVHVDASSESDATAAEEPSSVVISSLNLYKEAIANNDESKIAEIESFLKTIEDEKNDLEKKVATLSEELSYEKTRVLRVSADFDNFRKRTEKERLSLVSNAQGEVVENLLPVLDNFERAKAQIKVETEGEEKISNSYQNIYKQFVEILGSLGVLPVESVGKPFDPMLHEAIMREDSTEYEDGVILEEYRKGFQLGERLLRPSMVKVSSGPGPAKPQTENVEESKDRPEASEANGEGNTESTPTDE